MFLSERYQVFMVVLNALILCAAYVPKYPEASFGYYEFGLQSDCTDCKEQQQRVVTTCVFIIWLFSSHITCPGSLEWSIRQIEL